MVRIRLGAGWRDDPELRAALARGRAAAAHVVDAVAIEVDGVDLGAGRAEAELVPALEELVRAVARLVGGAHRAAVHFSEGGLELLLRRRGGSALLTLVSLGRPARVVASDVEVELAALARAAREAGEVLLADLAALGPAARTWGGALELELSRLAAARPAAPTDTPAPPPARAARRRRSADAPSCGFELHDDEGLLGSYDGEGPDLGSLLAPGRVWIRDRGGELLAVAGPPFLLLRDLAAFAARIAAARRRRDPRAEGALAAPGRERVALVADLAAGTFSGGGAPHPCSPLQLARVLLEAALDLCGAAAARHPPQARNPYVVELRRTAAEALEHVAELVAGDRVGEGVERVRARARRLPREPLAPGRMRHLAFRRSWELDVGAPAGEGLARAGELVVAAGAAAVVAVEADGGRERWRAAGASWAARAGDAVVALRGGALVAHELAGGRLRWTAPHEGAAPRAAALAHGGPLVLACGGELVALHVATGAIEWRHRPPAATELHLAAFGSLALAAGDAGFLYALDAAGRVAWRLHLPGPALGPAQPLGADGLVLCATDLGGAAVRFDAATGRRRHEAPLDFTPSAPAVPFAGLVGICGAVGGDPVVAALEPSGATAWTDAAPLAGPLVAASGGPALLVKTAGGACAALGRGGELLWAAAREAPHPPPANLPPVLARGVALVPGEHVVALDAARGATLGSAAVGAPVRLLVGPDLSLCAMDAEGLVLAARVATHLSVV